MEKDKAKQIWTSQKENYVSQNSITNKPTTD